MHHNQVMVFPCHTLDILLVLVVGNSDQQSFGRDGVCTTMHSSGNSLFGTNPKPQNEVSVDEVVVQQVEQTSTNVSESGVALQDEADFNADDAMRELDQEFCVTTLLLP
jgi:hypothetical protein